MIIEFDNTQYLEALPQQIVIYDEKSMKTDKSISLKEIFESKQIINNKLKINVRDLVRGTKIIHLMYSKPIDTKSVLFSSESGSNNWERKVERIILIN